MLTKTQHDFLVLLAEGVAPNWICDALGFNHPRTFNAKIYEVAKELEVEPCGDTHLLVGLVREEARNRGYHHEVYYFFWEPQDDTPPPPKLSPVLPRKEQPCT